MSLITKYRPKDFDEVIGQDTAIETLKGLLKKEDLPHSYIFAGPSGVGKTTVARIFADKLGCRPMDLLEIDVADLRGIDTVRDVKSWAFAKPKGKAKVCILDEAHMFTRDAQNALLKLLEEPPAHAYFIICTTEPSKLIETVRSRCCLVKFESVAEEEIEELLFKIVEAEGYLVPKKVIFKIASVVYGNVRSALSILERVVVLPRQKMAQAVESIAAEEDKAIALCRLLMKGGPWKEVAGLLKDLKGEYPESIRRLIMSYAATALLNGNKQAYKILDLFRDPVYDQFPLLVLNCYEVCHS